MDCEKRWQENNTNSVIATLMGFHELPSQQTFHGNNKVLSESYLRKAASIGLRPGSSFSNRRPSRRNSKILNGVKGVSEVQLLKNENDLVDGKCANSSTTMVKTLSRARNEDGKSIGQKRKDKSVLRYLQKYEHDSLPGDDGALGINYMNKSLKSHLETVDKHCLVSNSISPLKPMLENITYDHVPRGSGCTACPRNMNRIFSQQRQRSKFEKDAPHIFLSQSSLENGSKNQRLKKWKTAKDVRALDEVLALNEKISKPRNLNHGLGKNGLSTPSSLHSTSSGSCSHIRENDHINGLPVHEFEAMGETLSSGGDLKQDESTGEENCLDEQTNSQRDILEPLFRREFEQLNQDEMDSTYDNDKHREIEVKQSASKLTITDFPYTDVNGDKFASAEAFSIGVCSKISGDDQPESSIVILSGEGGHVPYVGEVYSLEASITEFAKEESAYPNFSSIGPPKFRDYSKRTNQHSPDSVLESLGLQNYSSFEHFESIGLKLQLEALNFEPEETYSEGSVMAISGDEDTEENIDDHSLDGKNVEKWLGDNQSRNFSYLVDVLNEAEIFGTKSFMDFKKWHSMECPISPFVFEALEKIYGKQTSWVKPERKLLFDRINSGLIDIFDRVINFRMSVKRRVCFDLRRDEVEDELWMMLIEHEKENSKDYLSEKARGKWVDFEEGMNIVCRELETRIFDELVMELVSLWN